MATITLYGNDSVNLTTGEVTRMSQQVFKAKNVVKRMDESVREQEAAQHEELMAKSRKAVKNARRMTKVAMDLVMQIEEMV